MTSPNSTAAYSEGELQKLLGYATHIQLIGGNYGFSACIVGMPNTLYPTGFLSQNFPGRLMSFFGTSLFVSGQYSVADADAW